MNTPKPTSHDYARDLQKMADWLLTRPAFETGGYSRGHHYFRFYEKDQFVDAAKSLGTGKKQFTADEISFKVELPFGSINIEAPRNIVCRLVRPAEYECDPFLSPEEEKSLGGAA